MICGFNTNTCRAEEIDWENVKQISGNAGDNVVWIFDDGCLTLSGTGNMAEYSKKEHPEYSKLADRITEVNIVGDIETLSKYAFASVDGIQYSKLTKANIISSSLKEIPAYCFFDDLYLSNVSLPEQIMKLDESAFGCTTVASLRGKWNTEQSKLDINIPGALASNSISSAFRGRILGDISFDETLSVIPKNLFFDSYIYNLLLPAHISEIGEKAFGYTKIDTLEFPKSSIKVGERAFQYSECNTISIPPTAILSNYVFSGCTADMVIFEEGVTDISRCTLTNSHINEIVLPNTLKRIAREAFNYCTCGTFLTAPFLFEQRSLL